MKSLERSEWRARIDHALTELKGVDEFDRRAPRSTRDDGEGPTSHSQRPR